MALASELTSLKNNCNQAKHAQRIPAELAVNYKTCCVPSRIARINGVGDSLVEPAGGAGEAGGDTIGKNQRYPSIHAAYFVLHSCFRS